MKPEVHEEYELIAKHCPSCHSLIMAKVVRIPGGDVRYSGYRCSGCSWESPANRNAS